MNRPLLWKLCLIIAAGIVSLFYLIDLATFRTEERMSLIEAAHRAELQQWADYAESLYHSKKFHELDQWLTDLQLRESTWAAVAKTEVIQISGSSLPEDLISGYHLGRSVDWKIHLYFHDNPTMELPFSNNQASLLVQLPERMRPGSNWPRNAHSDSSTFATKFTWLAFVIFISPHYVATQEAPISDQRIYIGKFGNTHSTKHWQSQR